MENSRFYETDRLKFELQPSISTTHLYIALKSFYETYHTWKYYYEYFDERPNKKIQIARWNGHGFVECYYKSIVFVHWAFEFICNDLLEHCLTNFTKISEKNEKTLISKLIDGSISTVRVGANNISSSAIRKRIALLIERKDVLPEQYHIDPKYHFLKDNLAVLDLLANLRNEIVHQGKTMLNRYTYECLFVNSLLPLIRKYLETQRRETLLERNLHCGLNVINEIIKCPLPEDYSNAKNYHRLRIDLRRINQFKELGRASYNNPLFMFENVQKENEFLLSNVNTSALNDAKDYGRFKREVLGHYKIYNCPCCGAESLTTDEFWQNISTGKVFVNRATCSTCTYRINKTVGEPKEFGIMEEELFVFV